MLQFVDSFYCTYNQQKEKYVFRLRQEEPVDGEPGVDVTIKTNEIANVILDKDCAIELAHAILQLHDSAQGNGHLPDDDMKETK